MPFIRKVMSRGYAYAQFVRTERIKGKVKTKVLSHLGPWSKLGDHLLEPKVSEINNLICYDHGRPNILHKTCEELQLSYIIDSNTSKGGGISPGFLSKIIIINHCMNPTSKSKIPEWFSTTTLPTTLNIDANKINKDNLTKVLDYFSDDKIEDIQKDFVNKLVELFQIKKDTLMYDITSTYFEGNKCEDAVFGYSRDGKKGTRQVNFGLIVSRMGKFPMLFRYFKGNVVDVTTVSETALKAKEILSLTETSIVMDRGMLSEDNIIELDRLKLGYIICMKKTNEVIKKMQKVSIKKCILINKDKKLYAYEYIETHNDKKKKFVVCISKYKQQDDYEKRERKIKKVEDKLKKLLKQSGKGKYKERDEIISKMGEILKGVKKYFKIKHEKNRLDFQFKLNESEIQKQKNLDGKYVILCSNIKTSISEIIEVYKDKDKAEKAFRVIKSYIRVRPIRHWKSQRVKAHIFLCVLAYLVQKVLEYRFDIEQKTTAQKLLYDLKGIKKIIYSVGKEKLERITKLNTIQIKILKKLDYYPL